MRLANLLRRVSPFVPARAGIPPTWDRPDPPTSAKTEPTKRLSIDEKWFYFNDVNSEVYQGDLYQAFPAFAGRFSLFFLAAAFIGSLGFIFGSQHKNIHLHGYGGLVENLDTQKKQFEQKYGLKDIQNNPWKLNSWPETFQYKEGGLSQDYHKKRECVQNVRKINGEALAYWTALYQKSVEAVKTGHH